MPGIKDGRSPRIAPRNSDEGQRPDVSSALIYTSRPQDNVTRGCTLPQLIGPMPTILTVEYEQEREKEREDPSNATDPGFSHNPPSAKRKPEGRNPQRRENKGAVPGRPTATLAEYDSNNVHPQVGEDSHGVVKSREPEGGCW